jgi:hypothetical protein
MIDDPAPSLPGLHPLRPLSANQTNGDVLIAGMMT